MTVFFTKAHEHTDLLSLRQQLNLDEALGPFRLHFNEISDATPLLLVTTFLWAASADL